MAVTHARLLVGTETPTLVTLPGVEAKTSLTVQVQNLGTGAIYLGGQGVSVTDYGVSIVPGAAVTIDRLSAKDEIYAIAQVTGEYVAVLRVAR
jgi:hypothetical protein